MEELYFAEVLQISACAYDQALATNSKRLALLLHDPDDLAQTYERRATILWRLGHFSRAITAVRDGLKIVRSHLVAQPDRLVGTLINLGTYLGRVGKYTEAVAADREAVVVARGLETEDHARFLHISLCNLGVHLGNLGQHDDALSAIQESLRHANKIVGDESSARQIGILTNLGISLSRVGRHDEAFAITTNIASQVEELSQHDPSMRRDHAFALARLSLGLGLGGQLVDAEQVASEACELFRKLLADHRVSPPHLAWALDTLGQILLEQQKYPEAAATFSEGLLYTKEHAQLRNALQDSLREACEAGDLPLPNQIPVAD